MGERVESSSVQLRILTLNVWSVSLLGVNCRSYALLFHRGLKFVSRKRKERIRAIAEYICTSPSSSSTSSIDSEASRSENTALHASRIRSNTTGVASGSHSNTPGSRWDVVCLQEVWCSEDWEYVKNRARESGSGLIHGRYFYRLVDLFLSDVSTQSELGLKRTLNLSSAGHLDPVSVFFPNIRL